ncbi:MAG: DUF4209 domain-containing protein [Candidatus Schmidhempelia sp.]|nr:DUF4209 domain-containing protein [Candidatus Schmidhempelia sp.]
METLLGLTKQIFIDCNWDYSVPLDDNDGYLAIETHLNETACKIFDGKLDKRYQVLKLLANIASITFTLEAYNKSDKFEQELKYYITEESYDQLFAFFAEILDIVKPLLLKARLADILWSLQKPKNRQHAQIAIDAYIEQPPHPDNNIYLNQDLVNCYKRAVCIGKQINDSKRLEKIRVNLAAILSQPQKLLNSELLLGLGDIVESLTIDKDMSRNLADLLYHQATIFKDNHEYITASKLFNEVARKYQHNSGNDKQIFSLIESAKCLELEADCANSIRSFDFYKRALDAYRKIPNKYREYYGINTKLEEIHSKINSLKQSVTNLIIAKKKYYFMDLSKIFHPISLSAEAAVSGKKMPVDALNSFVSLHQQIDLECLSESVESLLLADPMCQMGETTYLSSDGRRIANTSALKLPVSKNESNYKEHFEIKLFELVTERIEVVVEYQIKPALQQITIEHEINCNLLQSVCKGAHIVAENRVNFLSYGLWLGFQHEFHLAIQLLCPQFEHIVRSLLKSAGAKTSTINSTGIETENGLSTLMNLPEAKKIFGENQVIEIKTIFTEHLGFNLRNEIAHGLYEENSRLLTGAIYAWWLILRLVILSAQDSFQE